VGLAVTVAAASAGVKKAKAGVLSSLYGVGTDVTVTGAASGALRETQLTRLCAEKIFQTFNLIPGARRA
jgi:hypothetical protein